MTQDRLKSIIDLLTQVLTLLCHEFNVNQAKKKTFKAKKIQDEG